MFNLTIIGAVPTSVLSTCASVCRAASIPIMQDLRSPEFPIGERKIKKIFAVCAGILAGKVVGPATDVFLARAPLPPMTPMELKMISAAAALLTARAASSITLAILDTLFPDHIRGGADNHSAAAPAG